MNTGIRYSEELTLDEMMEIGETMATNKAETQIKQLMLKGKVVTQEQKDALIKFYKEDFQKGGNRKFFETVKDDLKDIPVSVFINIKAKQRNMAQNADKLSNILRTIMANPQAFSQIPGVGKAFNELLEESGMSSIDFTAVTQAPIPVANSPAQAPMQPLPVEQAPA